MAPSSPAYDVDWGFSTASNVHAAKDRAWFTTYLAFPTTLVGMGGSSLPVLGIGTVSLPLKRFGNRPGSKELLSHNVLHAPDLICNVVYAAMLMKDCTCTFDGVLEGILEGNSTGEALGILECPCFPKLRLKGQAPDCTSLNNRSISSVSVFWPAQEQARRKTILAQAMNVSSLNCAGNRRDVPYMDEERQWLKIHYGGDFHFLQVHALKIFEDKDRAEVGCIAKFLMLDDDEEELSSPGVAALLPQKRKR